MNDPKFAVSSGLANHTKPSSRPVALRLSSATALLCWSVVAAQAWEAKSGRICELLHDTGQTKVRVTYDPEIPEYSIAITVQSPWPAETIFAMRFDGPRGNTISTDRHVLSDNGATLSVTDSGFGNVLNGLEFNHTATALLGDRTVAVPLDGAAPAVQAFRACASGLSA